MYQQERYQALRRELDEEAFIASAKKLTGLSDFGPYPFRESLRGLLDCAARDTNFHEQGLAAFKGDMVRSLVNRLRMTDDIRRHPEILLEDVSDPIIVIGLGRSGTTKLHKMLSAPDSVQKTLFWRLWNPARFPDAAPGQPDPRIRAVGTSNVLSADNPVMEAGHRIAEQEVEEDWTLYTFGCQDWLWCQFMYVPSCFDWVMANSSLEVYRDVKVMLQYLQWQDGGKQGRPWILKSVGHIANMEALLECYPKATLVHPHRDPRSTIPSYSKLMTASWPRYGHPVDLHVTGTEVLKQWRTAIARYLKSRDQMGLDGRIIDVKYEQVREDPISVIRQIYQRAGIPLSAEAEQKMIDWHNSNEQHAAGAFKYSLEEFGLTEAKIDTAFAEYIRRFIER